MPAKPTSLVGERLQVHRTESFSPLAPRSAPMPLVLVAWRRRHSVESCAPVREDLRSLRNRYRDTLLDLVMKQVSRVCVVRHSFNPRTEPQLE